MTAPAEVKAALRRALAVDRLRVAAAALLAENTEVAQASFTVPPAVLTDAAWRDGDATNAKLCIELRRALKEVDRSFPTTVKPKQGNAS